jgi:ABC-type phosphate transport system ATPase subunit
MSSNMRFKPPFTCIIGGPTGSGKSTFCIRFLQNLDTLCTEPDFPGGIFWCYSEQSAVPRQQLTALKKKVDSILKTPKVYRVSVLDDLLNEAYSRAVCDLFTKGSHHRDLSVILITQIFSPSPALQRHIVEC